MQYFLPLFSFKKSYVAIKLLFIFRRLRSDITQQEGGISRTGPGLRQQPSDPTWKTRLTRAALHSPLVRPPRDKPWGRLGGGALGTPQTLRVLSEQLTC